MICVYALVSPSRMTPGIEGLRRERLRRIAFPRVHAIVGEMASAPKPTRVAIRRYDVVIRALADRFPAVLPARFGTCVLDVEELAYIVKSRQASFVRSLRLVKNRVQMTVRVFDPESTSHEAGPDGSRARTVQARATRPAAPSGREYLRARAAARDIPGTQAIRTAVTKWVTAERVERHEGQAFAGSIYHLMARRFVRSYQRALKAAALTGSVTTIVSGPWPPYAFADWDG